MSFGEFQFNPWNLAGSLVFSVIGFGLMGYGRKTDNYKLFGIGIALMGYTYLVSDTLLLYFIGCALVGCAVLFRD